VRARIPYLPVHADDLDREAAGLSLLVLPNVGALSDAQCAAIRRFVERGGSLFATGDTSAYDEWGDPRPDYALANLFGAHRTGAIPKLPGPAERQARRPADRFAPDAHTYLRLSPELRASVDGPRSGEEPRPSGGRHAVLRGFDETDILPYGGTLPALKTDQGALVPLTFVPPFPTCPPETAWMRQPASDIPGLVLTERGRSRIAFMPADVDRRYAQLHLPDHGDLLANLVRWTSGDSIPVRVEGPGLIDCHLYQQPGRAILHLVNLTSANTWRAPVEEVIPVGPLKVSVRLPQGVAGQSARLLVSGGTPGVTYNQGVATVEISSIADHEAILFG
jgi:hypothetical protein